MEPQAFQELATLLGPGGSVIAFIVWQVVRERRNGKPVPPPDNNPLLTEIRDAIREQNGHHEARDQRMEDIWDAVRKEL